MSSDAAREWAEELANLKIRLTELDRNDPKQMQEYRKIVKQIRAMQRERKGG